MSLRVSLAGAVLLAQAVAAVAQHMNLPDAAPCWGAAGESGCFWRAATAADQRLDKYLSQVRRVLAPSPSEIADLDKAQSLWAQYREADCAAERGLYGRGTGGPVTYYACLEAQSRARLTDLQAIYGWVLTK